MLLCFKLVFIFPYSYIKCLITNYDKLDFSHQDIFSTKLEDTEEQLNIYNFSFLIFVYSSLLIVSEKPMYFFKNSFIVSSIS